jgi:rhomboid protease GluP
LGELGRVNELLDALQQFTHALQQAGNAGFLNTARMYALAFCGQSESLAWFLQCYLPDMPTATQQFWQATAYWYAGAAQPGQQLFQELQSTADPAMQAAIATRLAQAPRHVSRQLNLPSQHYLAQLQVQIMRRGVAERQWRSAQPSLKQIPVTASLIALNVAISVIFFGALFLIAVSVAYADRLSYRALQLVDQLLQQVYRVYDLGVLYPEKVQQGEWWRLVTAIFLHAGWMHLLGNMIGLYVLGAIVEPMLGKYRYLIGYFVTGIGSMVLVTVLANLNLIREAAVVGASGAIMGLLGMIGSIFLIRWRQNHEAIAVQRLKMVGLIIVFQTIFDMMTPRVSMAGHLSGLGVGFVMGIILLRPNVGKVQSNHQ